MNTLLGGKINKAHQRITKQVQQISTKIKLIKQHIPIRAVNNIQESTACAEHGCAFLINAEVECLTKLWTGKKCM